MNSTKSKKKRDMGKNKFYKQNYQNSQRKF